MPHYIARMADPHRMGGDQLVFKSRKESETQADTWRGIFSEDFEWIETDTCQCDYPYIHEIGLTRESWNARKKGK